jgi:D-alanine-D-alanine ligase
MTDRPYIPVLHGAALDRPDEADTLDAAAAVRDALVRHGYRSDIVHVGLDLEVVRGLAGEAPLCVFNLVEALDGDAGLAGLVPAVLEHCGLTYTGGDAQAWQLTTSKSATKTILRGAGLPTPAWSLDGSGFTRHDTVIVKSLTEHASVGIDAGSVVPGDRAGREIAAREAQFGGTFFAEQFIDGREFNISLLQGPDGAMVLPLAEIDFIDFPEGKPHIVDYEAKWVESAHAFHHTPRRFDFPPRDAALLARLRRFCLATWDAFALSGYARIDFRVDGAGEPYILEINVNPGLGSDAGFVAAAAQAGLDYEALILHIVAAARRFRQRAA